MKKLTVSLGGAVAVALLVAATVTAAGSPGHGPRAGAGPGSSTGPGPQREQAGEADVVAAILGLSQEQIADLRHEGLSLAQIAERQQVDPQLLVDALTAQWTVRIDDRLSRGAITVDEAATLKAELTARVTDMVYSVEASGMQGAAVGAGPAAAGQGQAAGPANGQSFGQGTMGTGWMNRGSGNGAGYGSGDGVCHGTGPLGAAGR